MNAQTFRFEFATEAIPEPDFQRLCAAFAKMSGTLEASWLEHVVSAIADEVLAPEIMRRMTGDEPQARILELAGASPTADEVLGVFAWATAMETKLRAEGCIASADFFQALAAGFAVATECAYLERLAGLPDERPVN